MNRTIAALILCPFLFFSINVHGTTIYVSQGEQGTGNSWTDALGSLQSAIALADAGDDIWVKKGEYFPTECSDCTEEQREISFAVPIGVSLYGGFNGTETSLTQRNISSNPTILNGNIGSLESHLDNSFSILTFEFPDEQNIIDGFTIINGQANGDGDSLGPKRSGGGIHVRGNGANSQADLIIRNCKFLNNRSSTNGGAIHFYGGFSGACEFELKNCEFEGNYAEQKGGGIFAYSSFDGSIIGNILSCKFSENLSYEGGAIYTLSSNGQANIDFSSTIFQYNKGHNKGGAITCFTSDGSSTSNFIDCLFKGNESNSGGALYLDGSNQGLANDHYENCLFLKNRAKSGGGAIFANGSNGTSNSTYKNCDFDSNYSIQSGAAFFNSGSNGGTCLPIFDKCRFKDNKTTMYGAGMYNFGKTGQSSPIITNCLFTGNEADSGASIYNYGGQNGNSNPKILNCTFTTNFARVGPCVYNQASDTSGTVQTFVSNCIFWENIATSGFGLVFQNGHAEPTIQYSIIPFDDCDLLNTQPNSTLTCGPGIIFNQDPNFKNPFLGDFRLQDGSPALNIGILDSNIPDSFDLDGRNRVVGNIDLGSFEFDPNSSTGIVNLHPGGEYCQNDSLTLYIETYGPVPLNYQWFFNGVSITGANSQRLTIDSLTPNDQGVYFCELETTDGTITSQEVSIEVRTAIIPEIELITDTQFCEGQGMKSVKAIMIDVGYFPAFSWILNGTVQNEISTTFDFIAENQDELTFEVISNDYCNVDQQLTSSSLIFEELNEVVALASIEFDQEKYCDLEEVIMTAVLTNAGNQPELIWQINGEVVANDTTTFSIDSGLGQNGDTVQLFLTSDLNCVENAEVSSEVYTLEFNSLVDPEIDISFGTDSICQDSLVLFSASVQNEGDNPIIDWFVNGSFIESTGELEWETSFSELQSYGVLAQLNSDAFCASSTVVNSNLITIEVVNCMTSGVNFHDFFANNVYPNPAEDVLIIETNLEGWLNANIEIFNADGYQIVEDFDLKLRNKQMKISVNNLLNGWYFGRISNDDKVFYIRFLVLR